MVNVAKQHSTGTEGNIIFNSFERLAWQNFGYSVSILLCVEIICIEVLTG